MQPIIESKCMDLYLDVESKYLKMEWKGYGKDEEIIDIISKGLKLIKEKRLTKILIDSLSAPTLNTNIQQWLNVEFMSKISELGLKKMAMIMPQKITAVSAVNRMSTSEESKTAMTIMETQFFNTNEEAIKWIKAT
jgi:hypothetical protein